VACTLPPLTLGLLQVIERQLTDVPCLKHLISKGAALSTVYQAWVCALVCEEEEEARRGVVQSWCGCGSGKGVCHELQCCGMCMQWLTRLCAQQVLALG
jgi:hypothetical protein